MMNTLATAIYGSVQNLEQELKNGLNPNVVYPGTEWNLMDLALLNLEMGTDPHAQEKVEVLRAAGGKIGSYEPIKEIPTVSLHQLFADVYLYSLGSDRTKEKDYITIITRPKVRQINFMRSLPDIKLRDYKGRTPLMCLSWNGFHPEIQEQFIGLYAPWEAGYLGVSLASHLSMIRTAGTETSIHHIFVDM